MPSESGSSGGRKGAGRVEVIYFAKKAKHARRASREVAVTDPGRKSAAQARDLADLPTEPAHHLTEQERAELARAERRRTRTLTPTDEVPTVRAGTQGPSVVRPGEAKPRVRPAGRSSGRKTSSERNRRRQTNPQSPAAALRRARGQPEPETEPGQGPYTKKLGELLEAPSPSEPLRSMTRVELAELSLFGHQLFEQGRLSEARVVFEGIVGLDVQEAFPHTMLGTIYLAMGRQDRAVALFEAALAIDPRDLAARVYRSEVRLKRGQLKAAVTDLQAIVKKGAPEDPFVQRARRLMHIAEERGRRR